MAPSPAEARRLATALALLVAAGMVGCAGGRQGRRLDLGGLPALSGSHVRSQDGTQLARGPGSRRKAPAAPTGPQLAASEPRVRWTEPPAPPAPAPEPERPALVRLPAPPDLPAAEALPPPAVAVAAPPAPRPSVENASNRQPVPPAAPAPAAGALEPLEAIGGLVAGSRQRLEATANYRATMNRQERIGETLQPAEEVVLSIRREPKAVRLEWPSGKNEGREVLYSTAETGGQMQVYTPGALLSRLSFDPNSPLVMRNSRHPITEAGFDSILSNLEGSLAAARAGGPGAPRMTYGGTVASGETGRPCHKIDEARADGERWTVYLDAETLLPSGVIGTDAAGQLLERYTFRDLRTDLPELAEADAFRPEARWAEPAGGAPRGGILSRLGGGQNPAGPAVR